VGVSQGEGTRRHTASMPQVSWVGREVVWTGSDSTHEDNCLTYLVVPLPGCARATPSCTLGGCGLNDEDLRERRSWVLAPWQGTFDVHQTARLSQSSRNSSVDSKLADNSNIFCSSNERLVFGRQRLYLVQYQAPGTVSGTRYCMSTSLPGQYCVPVKGALLP